MFPMLATLAGVFGTFSPAATSPSTIFNEIFLVFIVLGTLVGVVVIGYMLWKAYEYRAGDGKGEDLDVDRPSLGELPTGGDGGRKLFLSFGISTIIVVSLIVWTYGALLTVESGPPPAEQAGEPVEIKVTGFQFGWQFEYENGYTASGQMRIPEDRPVKLTVTSTDVFHNFGIPGLSLKADAIPGQTTETWFVAEEPGTHQAQCYELCGTGHSFMQANVIVMEQDEYQEWYQSTQNETAS